jgi:hypothetical protein
MTSSSIGLSFERKANSERYDDQALTRTWISLDAALPFGGIARYVKNRDHYL